MSHEQEQLQNAINWIKQSGELGETEQEIVIENEQAKEVKEEQPLQEAIHFVTKEEKAQELKQYLLLYVVEEDDKEIRSFEWITGRRTIYDFLCNMIKEGTLDCKESTVILEGSPIEYGVTVYKFMKLMETRFPEETFNIDNYVDPDDFAEEE